MMKNNPKHKPTIDEVTISCASLSPDEIRELISKLNSMIAIKEAMIEAVEEGIKSQNKIIHGEE